MDVAEGVRLHQAVGHLRQDVSGALGGELAFTGEQSGQRLAIQEFHGEEQAAIVRAAKVVDLGDVIVVDLADGDGFAAEALDGVVA